MQSLRKTQRNQSQRLGEGFLNEHISGSQNDRPAAINSWPFRSLEFATWRRESVFTRVSVIEMKCLSYWPFGHKVLSCVEAADAWRKRLEAFRAQPGYRSFTSAAALRPAKLEWAVVDLWG
jgi:hypothetical protein